MINIIFESHATTFDNEAHIASGHNDVALSPLGEKQAKELGERYKEQKFDAIFCSDLQRSFKTAEIAFGTKFPIIQDKRLRECDYGDLTGHPSSEVDPEKIKKIKTPFPNGESYEQTSARMKSFLNDLFHLRSQSEGKFHLYHGRSISVLIIGHRATQYGLEHWIKGLPLEEIISAPWKWQLGWKYLH